MEASYNPLQFSLYSATHIQHLKFRKHPQTKEEQVALAELNKTSKTLPVEFALTLTPKAKEKSRSMGTEKDGFFCPHFADSEPICLE